MWASSEEKQSNKIRVSDSSSKSSSTSSCSSPFSAPPLPPPPSTPRRKTMEEVWKDISLTNLQDRPNREEGRKSRSYRGTILQDFLARPFNKEPPTNAIDPPEIDIGHFPLTPSTLPPATALSLNSGPEFHGLDPVAFHNHQRNDSHLPFRTQSHQFCANYSSNLSPMISGSSTIFDGLGLPLDQSSSHKKRGAETDKNNTNDRRHKRMIKNRESAARSRSRKQAYTNELELEVAHLLEENAKLRKQQQQLCVAAPSAQVPQKHHSLYRTSTAPF